MYASIKWRHLDHVQLLSRAKYSLTAIAHKEVCPGDEIVDPLGTNELFNNWEGRGYDDSVPGEVTKTPSSGDRTT